MPTTRIPTSCTSRFTAVSGSATAARMVALDKVGMDLEVTVPEGMQRLRIPFDHCLQDEADAQRTLVAMSRHAQTVITVLAGSEESGR